MSFYKVPFKYRQRIHFVRPRFKANIENVLLYMANACCRIKPCSCSEFNQKFTNALRLFPGNITASEKTIANWRTETPALFSFYKENKERDMTQTSKMAFFLNENQDLTQFFKLFLFTFQFPGGHLKPNENIELISRGVKFKPAKLIIQVLMECNKILRNNGVDKNFSISAEEVTYCIFDDTRVTNGTVSPKQVAEVIVNNRHNKVKYYDTTDEFIFSSKGTARSKGDVTRYAGDILDYMEIASLLSNNGYGYYGLCGDQKTLNLFADNSNYFAGYDSFYGKKNIEVSEVSAIEQYWYEYVDNNLKPELFKTDIADLVTNDNNIPQIYKEQIQWILDNNQSTRKDTGNIGESIVEGHEKVRLINMGYPDLSKRVQIVDSPSYHPGFDIDSFEGDEEQLHRYIEVKTTISKNRIQQYDFHMSTNEWSVASTHLEHYCVYRLMLNSDGMKLYILRNPVALYKTDKIDAVPRDGMDVHFDSDKFKTTEVLTCII